MKSDVPENGAYKVLSRKKKILEFSNGTKRDFKLHYELEMQKRYGYSWRKKLKQLQEQKDVQGDSGEGH